MKVIQRWDDGLLDDIRLVEIFRHYGAKATFCLNPGLYKQERSLGWMHGDKEVWRLSLNELGHVYKGFDIASHSMTHPCLTDLPIDRLWWEINESKTMLESIFNRAVSGFCYPFNAYNNIIKEEVRSAGYVWARGGADTGNIISLDDLFDLRPSCHFLSENFLKIFHQARDQNGIFFFWGHSYELMTENMWNKFRKTIEMMATDPEIEWCNISELIHHVQSSE
jgi:peptidoglycan/xylan/chitin deacetylase (PgdA/CDA1 family)